jgi:hypothetical protein
MSAETDTDELATTSLISTSANNNAAASRSRLKSDSQHTVEQHKVHFNIAEDGEKRQKVSAFIRDVQPRQKSSTSNDSANLASRLSMAIRKSLRMGPKQRSTAVQSPTAKDEHRAFRFGEDKNVTQSISFYL